MRRAVWLWKRRRGRDEAGEFGVFKAAGVKRRRSVAARRKRYHIRWAARSGRPLPAAVSGSVPRQQAEESSALAASLLDAFQEAEPALSWKCSTLVLRCLAPRRRLHSHQCHNHSDDISHQVTSPNRPRPRYSSIATYLPHDRIRHCISSRSSCTSALLEPTLTPSCQPTTAPIYDDGSSLFLRSNRR